MPLLTQPLVDVASLKQWHNDSVEHWVREVVRNHQLMLLMTDQYATPRYFERQGIDFDLIEGFLTHVHEVVRDGEFFIWSSLQREGFSDPLSRQSLQPIFSTFAFFDW